jgi:hypothetical protein
MRKGESEGSEQGKCECGKRMKEEVKEANRESKWRKEIKGGSKKVRNQASTELRQEGKAGGEGRSGRKGEGKKRESRSISSGGHAHLAQPFGLFLGCLLRLLFLFLGSPLLLRLLLPLGSFRLLRLFMLYGKDGKG